MGYTPPFLQKLGFDQTESVTVPPGSGDVVGPASATDTALAAYDGATGKLLKDTAVTYNGTDKSLNFEEIGPFGPRGTKILPAGFTMWDDMKGTGDMRIGYAIDGSPRFDFSDGVQVAGDILATQNMYAAAFNVTDGEATPAEFTYSSANSLVTTDKAFKATELAAGTSVLTPDGTTGWVTGTAVQLNGEMVDGDQTFVKVDQTGITQYMGGGGASFDIVPDVTGVLRVSAMGTLISDNLSSYPDMSAMLEIDTPYRGFLGPRMTTTQRNAISSPAEGLEIYNTTTKAKNVFNGTDWVAIGAGGGGGMTVPVEMVTSATEPLAADRSDGWLIFLKDVAMMKIRDTVGGVAKWREIGGSVGGNKFGSAKFGSAKLA